MTYLLCGETHPCTNKIWQLHHQQSLPPPSLLFRGECFLLRRHDRPFKNVNPVKSQIWDRMTTQAHLRTVLRHQGMKRGNSSNFHLFRPKCIPVWGLRIFSWCLKFVFNNLKLLFSGQRSYAVYSVQRLGSMTGMLFMTVLNWELSCDLTSLLRQKGTNLFLQVFLSLYLWNE